MTKALATQTKQKIKPSPMLLKLAATAGIELHKTQKRRKGESLLNWRIRDWGIPPCTSQPIDDQVIVWRLPPLELTPGGIIIPGDERSPNVKGIILAMGPRAMDTLCSNGIELGHIVVFARFAGWETHDSTPEYARHNQVLILKAKDINTSDDLKAAMDAGKMKYVRGDDGRYRLAIVKKAKALPSERKKKLLALANGTTNENEAAVARKLARKEP